MSAFSQDMNTPVLRMFREHQALMRAGNAHISALTSPEEIEAEYRIRFWDPMDALTDQIMAAPSTCAADFAAKVCAWTNFGEHELDNQVLPELWAEARQLLGVR